MRQHGKYGEFFEYYLEQHRHPANRMLHVVGTLGGIAVLIAALALRHPWWGLLALPLAYGFAWVGHFAFEHNRPATFGNPLWSLISDLRMVRRVMMTGERGK